MFAATPFGAFLRAVVLSSFSVVGLVVDVAAGAEPSAPPADADAALGILTASQFQGGLIVHLGCGDGEFSAALSSGGDALVHGIDANAENVERARARIRSLGLYSKTSIGQFDGEHLPYADNLVNLLVATDRGKVSGAEMMRVLRPGGVAYVRADGRWQRADKPWPQEIDDWTHFLYGAGGNAVSADRRVTPPRRLQWDAGPRYSRSHETDMSVTALVSCGGRLFHTLDEGPIGIHETPLPARRLPDDCSLIARDAFNGIVLWKRAMPGWGSSAWDDSRWQFGVGDQLWSAPLTLPRRLVAVGNKVYVTLGFRACVSELDATTGKTLREFTEAGHAEEMLFSDGLLILRRRDKQHGDSIAVIDVDTGRIVWKRQAGRVADLTLAVDERRVCFVAAGELVALDLPSGRELWKAPLPGPSQRSAIAGTLVMHGGVVLCTASRAVHAFAAADGKPLWSKPVGNSFRGMPDVFAVDGLAWIGTLTTVGLDLQTGEESRRIEAEALFTAGHHVRCHRAKATCGYLLSSKRGVEFLDLSGNGHSRHDWFRGTCRYGVMPANGLLYAPPHPCFCYPGVKLTGFNALAGGDGGLPGEPRGPFLLKGPAYGSASEASEANSADWPTYRRDNARSGRAASAVSTDLARSWQTQLRGKLTPPAIAGGRLYVAEVDTHSVHCLSAADGKPLWTYTAGGPVDSPPTIHQGRVLFGCTDGSVICLRASDGELVWRFHAAPSQKLIVSYGRLESTHPVHGSVLVEGDVVYFAAGRSSFLDGGIYLYGLDVATGAIRHRRHLDGPHPDPTQPNNRAHEMDGAKNDLLVCDGRSVFLMQNAFDLSLRPLPTPTIAKHGARKMDRHLLATGGFLNDSGFDRTYWMLAERWPGLYVAVNAPKAGQILAFDDETVYGLHVFNRKFGRSPYFNPGDEGYELFADEIDNEPALDEANARRERGTMSRSTPPKWSVQVPVRARAMVLAGETLFFAGPPDVIDPQDTLAALEGRAGAELWAVSTTDGHRLGKYPLEDPPVFDGMAAAGGRLYISARDGKLICFEGR